MFTKPYCMRWIKGQRCIVSGDVFMYWLFNSPKRPTVYPQKYAHGFVVICFVVVMQSFIMNSHEVFIIFIRVALLELEQSLDCHSASEVSLMDMGKSVNV